MKGELHLVPYFGPNMSRTKPTCHLSSCYKWARLIQQGEQCVVTSDQVLVSQRHNCYGLPQVSKTLRIHLTTPHRSHGMH